MLLAISIFPVPGAVLKVYTHISPFIIHQVAQLVKNPSAMQETLFQSLGQEDPLEEGIATHSSILGLPWWLSW